LIILLGGGSFVVDGTGGYKPCAGNVTMDRVCMYSQPPTYLFWYILHYIGGGFCIVSWFLDGCHILPWSMQLAHLHDEASPEKTTTDQGLAHTLTIFCASQQMAAAQPALRFGSSWHVISKAAITVLMTSTWLVLVDWSTEPELSERVHSRGGWVSLSSLLGIFWLEVIVCFLAAAITLRQFKSGSNPDAVII
jgi:hypothetical protein